MNIEIKPPKIAIKGTYHLIGVITTWSLTSIWNLKGKIKIVSLCVKKCVKLRENELWATIHDKNQIGGSFGKVDLEFVGWDMGFANFSRSSSPTLDVTGDCSSRNTITRVKLGLYPIFVVTISSSRALCFVWRYFSKSIGLELSPMELGHSLEPTIFHWARPIIAWAQCLILARLELSVVFFILAKWMQLESSLLFFSLSWLVFHSFLVRRLSTNSKLSLIPTNHINSPSWQLSMNLN